MRFANETGLSFDEAIETLVEEGLRQIRIEMNRAPRGADPERTIGMFADALGFDEAMDEVIARREERYSEAS